MGVLWRWPADAATAIALELGPRCSRVEHLAHFNSACDKIFARTCDVGDDQVEALGRAWRRRCHLRPKLNRAR